MAIHSRDLLSLPVETKSGRPLGKVVGFFIDPMGHKITTYEVGHGLFTKVVDHLISEQQVLSISTTKMVVEDASLKSALSEERERAAEKEPSPATPIIHFQRNKGSKEL